MAAAAVIANVAKGLPVTYRWPRPGLEQYTAFLDFARRRIDKKGCL